MKKYIKQIFVVSIVVSIFVFSCTKKKQDEDKRDSILEGKTTILVDETLFPIIEDELAVFQNSYDANITLDSQSEKESILSLANGKADIVVLPRKLNKEELAVFKQKNIIPRETEFAIDAITFIKNKKSNDTLVNLNDIIDFLKGNKNGIKGLVFDNPNSSTADYLTKIAGINGLPSTGVFSFKTNEDVIKYVAENNGMIGVVGINWMFQPKPVMQQYNDQVNILSVKDENSKEYVYPSQENIATRKYPLARVLYIVNCQGYEGLGMGFSSFIAGEIGQRIILKSGLAPMREPSRNIRTRNKIEN